MDTETPKDRLSRASIAMSLAAKESVRARKAYADACTEYAKVYEDVTGKKYQPGIIRSPEWPQAGL